MSFTVARTLPSHLKPSANLAPQLVCNIPAFSCQVFEVMNSYDLGCGPGGGDNARQVFEAAGLAFSDGDVLTSVRKSENRGGRGSWVVGKSGRRRGLRV